jgi:hypothetical protein
VRITDGPRTGQTARAALLPFTMDGQRLGVRSATRPCRASTRTHCSTALGLPDADMAALRAAHAVA